MTPTPASQPCTASNASRDKPRVIGRYGSGDGPTLVLIGGVHGNEPAGLHAAQRVIEHLHRDLPGSFQGSLVALAGNLAALGAPPGTRYVDRDLNRSFTPDLLATHDPGCAECREAREILDAVRAEQRPGRPLYVVDMHTTSAPAPPVVVIEDALPARRFGQHFGPALLLGFEEEVEGLLTDHLTRSLGCVACVIEGGQHDDPDAVDVLEAVCWVALDAAGILPIGQAPGDPKARLLEAAGERAGRVYDLRHREPITDPSFEMLDGMDAHTHVHGGQPVATQCGEPVASPIRGEMFLPNRQPAKRVGDDAFFIVREVSPGWLDLSARCRQSLWLASAIARLPGVHRCADEPHALLVDAKVAAVLKRQLFHLLGYRIVRRGDDPRVPRFRPWAALRGFLSAAWHRRTPTGAGDERFWLVARRTLDIAPESRDA